MLINSIIWSQRSGSAPFWTKLTCGGTLCYRYSDGNQSPPVLGLETGLHPSIGIQNNASVLDYLSLLLYLTTDANVLVVQFPGPC